VAVRRRPSYGFSLAGTSFGVSPEVGVSKSTLAQLFPELDLGTLTPSTKPEEVEKPAEGTPTTTGTGVTSVSPDETIPGSEFQKYNLEGKLTYGAPFNIQFGPTGPQGRGSRLGYSGSVSTQTPTGMTTPTQVGASSQSSVALPKYEMPEFDYSPFESLLEQGRGILSSIQEAARGMTSAQQMEPGAAEPTSTEAPASSTAAPSTASTVPVRLQVKQAAEAAGGATNLGKTGVKGLLSQGVDPTQIEKQARAAGVSLGSKAQSAVDRAQVKAIAQAPTGLKTQVQQVAQATDAGRITQAGAQALISSGASAARIERIAEKQGIDIGKQAQQLIDKAQDKKGKK
jgi:hypothetical protein